MNGRLATDKDVVDLERSEAGSRYDGHGVDRGFLNRMKRCGYLDVHNCRTSGLERLRIQYQQDGLVLFLGAGVSKASGIPEWRGLIDSMLVGFGLVRSHLHGRLECATVAIQLLRGTKASSRRVSARPVRP